MGATESGDGRLKRLCVIVVALSIAGRAFAQNLDGLHAAVGSRVRVVARDGNVEKGRLGLVGDSTLSLDASKTILLRDVIAVDRSRGRSWITGAAMGFPIGVLIGGVAGYAIGYANEGHNEMSGIGVVYGSGIGAISGGVIGSVIGAVVAPERWRTVFERP
jgi:hypothetical protein